MSSISSRESAASASGSNEPGCASSPSVKSTHSASECCENTGPPSTSIPTSESSLPNNSEQTEFPWTSSAEGSPARTSASPEMAQALEARAAAYGLSTPDLLAKFDPATSSWRTSQHSLEGGLTLFSETWPRSGLMRSGIAYQLPPLVRLTDEIVSGSSLPTPRPCSGLRSSGANRTEMLRALKLWPTPRAEDSEQTG